MSNQYTCTILALAAAALLWSCNNETGEPAVATAPDAMAAPKPAYNELEKAGWLIGAWRSISPEGTAYEVWRRETDSTFTAKSFIVKGKDTIPQEQIKLIQTGTDLYFMPMVNGQNGGKTVSFKMTSATADSFLFENPAHDFPQKISYRRVSTDSLAAQISGKMNGKETAINFPMGRVN